MQNFICEKCGNTTCEQVTQTQLACLKCGHMTIFREYVPLDEFQLSGDENLLDFEKKINYVKASLGKRLSNYLIDILCIFSAAMIFQYLQLSALFPAYSQDDVITFFILLLLPVYYISMEYKFGKTIGKYFTRTKVISLNGSPLTFGQCVARTLCRIIPLDIYSGLFFGGIFWHDSIPKTLVIED